MDVNDPAAKRLKEWLGVNSVVTGVDHELDALRLEEVTHRRIAFLRRNKAFLSQLTERDAALARKCRSSARRAVGGHRNHIEAALDQVSQVRSLAGNDDAELQRITTRSGPA